MFKLQMARAPGLRVWLLIILAICWLTGIILDAWLLLPQPVLLIGAGSALLASGFFWREPVLRSIGLALFVLLLGAWRYSSVSLVNDAHAVSVFSNIGKVEIDGTIIDEPHLETNSSLLDVSTSGVSLDNGQSWQDVRGEIEVQVSGATFDDPYGPHYGDTLTLTGVLSAPPPQHTPEIVASMVFPGLYLSGSEGNPFLVALYHERTMLAGIFLQALPQPLAALFSALFLSLRTPALKPLISAFTVTGTAHLIAPSGFKVTLVGGLIAEGTRWLLPRESAQDRTLLPEQRRRGNWRRWTQTLLVMLGIALYTVLSGAGPAAIRAGFMGMLLVCAPRLGRIYNVYTALALSGVLMSLFDPFILWDAGFQLSFVGTLGIVLFTPFFQRLLSVLTRFPVGQQIREIVAVTLAAQVATLPIFALSFNQISFVAPLANVITVPLLGLLLSLGTLICLSGCISISLATLCGWVAWPLLKYFTIVIPWCADLPGAYMQVDTLPLLIALGYYALAGGLILFLFMKWPTVSLEQYQHRTFFLSNRGKRVVQLSLALLVILITGILARTFQTTDSLKITLLTSGASTQGQALFLRTPDGLTALIDQGANSTTLAATLDEHLPFWQRSLDLIILTDTSGSNIDGLQDVITRYQVNQVVDAGMLHPGLAYARWRRTLSERNLHYTQVRQGAVITLGRQVRFQVLSPSSQLHKGSDETYDNAMILRLQAPGLDILLLNTADLSSYALKTVLADTDPNYLRAEFVFLTSSSGKVFPSGLENILMQASPSFVVDIASPSKKNLKSEQSTALSHFLGSWQLLQTQQVSTLEITDDFHGWNLAVQPA